MLYKKNLDSNFLKNKKILELGSGTGILGIFCSLIESNKVIFTDKKNVLELVTLENINMNLKKIYNNKSFIKYLDWDWDFNKKLLKNKIEENIGEIDILIASNPYINLETYNKFFIFLYDFLKIYSTWFENKIELFIAIENNEINDFDILTTNIKNYGLSLKPINLNLYDKNYYNYNVKILSY